jgi:hypothetical protein
MLPVVGQNIAQSKSDAASLLMAGLIVIPQTPTRPAASAQAKAGAL